MPKKERNPDVKWKCLLPAILLVSFIGAGAQSRRPPAAQPPEQTVFQADQDSVGYPVERHVAIPNAVLQILRRDGGVSSCLENNHLSPDRLPHSWFIGSRIHLDGPSETDLVILPDLSPDQSGCFHGIGSVAWFWVFRQTRNSYQLVLSVGAGALRVLDTRTKGYRDIEASSWTATASTTTTFKFDGSRYTESQSKPEASD